MLLPTASPPMVAFDAARARAARQLLAIIHERQRAGRSLLSDLWPQAPFEPGLHYPEGEIWHPETHAQYFYHAHPEPRAVEHGHFHLFLGQAGMSRDMIPLVLPEMAMAAAVVPQGKPDPGTHRSARDRGVFSHLIAISVDAAGYPLELFTTNRWVTGETWYRADDVIAMLDRFDLPGDPIAPVIDRWIVAVMRFLRPQIIDLIIERDAAVMDWRRRRSRNQHVFDDRRLEVTSAQYIDFAAELAVFTDFES